MRHTPEVNGASSPPLLYAECASPLETGLFLVHARWCPRGSRRVALREWMPPKARAAGPVVRMRTAPARRLTGQDAGPYNPWKRRRARGGWSRYLKPPSLVPRTWSRGARAAAGLRPLPGPFLLEHCPPFTTRAAQRGHQIPLFILDTSSPLDTILLFLFNKSLSEAWRHAHCVCRLLLPPQLGQFSNVQMTSHHITFIVTSPQHKCLGEWNSWERAPNSAKNKTVYI